ncbi:LppU/SCO3897 family protein [Streptomyces sp. NPDC003943]
MTTPPPSDPFAAAPGAAPMAPPPAPKKKGGKLKAILTFLVLIVVVGAVKFGVRYGFDFLAGDTPVHAGVGDCVTVSGPENDPKVDTQDCNSGKKDLYKVAQVHEDTFDLNKCDQNKYSALAQQYDMDKFVLCLEDVNAK